jgi:hypothetical protein
MSEHPPAGQNLNNPSVRSEPSDLSFRGVVIFGVGLVAVLLAVAAGAWGFLMLMSARAVDQKKLETSWPRELPPSPRLEGLNPETAEQPPEIREQVRRENQRLESYGWVKGEQGVVHIPIKVAMKKLANKLPAREGSDTDEFLHAPSGSSSGRMPRGGTE